MVRYNSFDDLAIPALLYQPKQASATAKVPALIWIHGGPGGLGILNMQESRPAPYGGLIPVHGTSYIQIVSFDNKGPVADAILSYSQSTNPASPHFADQTRAYAAKQWHRQPFHKKDIAAQAIAKPKRIAE